MLHTHRFTLLSASLLTALVLGVGCSASHYTKEADREVYGIVAGRQEAVFGDARPFSLERRQEALEPYTGARACPPAVLADAPEGEAENPLPDVGPDAMRLGLAEALRLAVLASRDFQDQRETLYQTALALTAQRHVFDPIFSATGSPTVVNDERDRERTFESTSEIGYSHQLVTGAAITTNLALAALKFINQQLGDTVGSTLAFTFDQPLWAGADPIVVQDNLIQAEKNVTYAVRIFARYEKTFAVGIASDYLRVLEARQVVLNEHLNYLSLRETRERAESLAEAERLPEFQVDQARQDELRAYNRWVTARESYLNTLDSFKLVLGIPTACPIELDHRELDALAAGGLRPLAVDTADAARLALETRLDLANARGGVEDAERRIRVAKDALKGDINFVASLGYESDPNSAQSARIQFHHGNYAAGFDIDLPLDRLDERNALREAEINRDAARRTLTEQEDRVVLAVRQAVRTLEQARQSYDTQRVSVELAERRVESTRLLLQAGRASQRDVLEAQDALIQAQNALTGALVDHTIAGLELQRDVGTLVVDPEGQIHGFTLSNP